MCRNYRELTAVELGEIAALYPVTPNREIARKYDISVDALVDYLAAPRGWKKDYKAVLIGSRGGHSLTEKQIAWIIKHYKHTKNADILAKFGIGETALHRIARKYGLKKTRQQMKKTQQDATSHAYEVCRKYGIYAELSERKKQEFAERKARGLPHPGGFKKGVSNKDRLGPKRFKECMEKAAATMREVRRNERMRMRWGLPQKTKLRLSFDGVISPRARKKIQYRNCLRKKGYICEWGEDTVYYDEHTQRSEKMEANAMKVGLRFEQINN